MNDDESFLEAIAARPDDPAARLIYADWLDERGDPRGAALRALIEWQALPPDDPARAPLAEKMRAAPLTLEWLMRLAAVPIECCEDDDCPREWRALPIGPHTTWRECQSCQRAVEWCRSTAEARPPVWRGSPVAIDPRAVRTPGDLQPPNWNEEALATIRLQVHRRATGRRRRSGL